MGANQSKKYILATYERATVFVNRDDATYYDNLRTALHTLFKSLSKDSMIIQTNELDVCDGEYVDIPDELWVGIGPRVCNINVISRPPTTYLSYGVHDGSPLSPKENYLVATDGKFRVFVRRAEVTNYENLIITLLRHFPELDEDYIVVQTNQMKTCAGRYVDILPSEWSKISPQIHRIKVISRLPKMMTISVQLLTGETASVTLPQSASVSDLAEMVHIYNGYFIHRGEWLESDRNLSSYNIREGAKVQQVKYASQPWWWAWEHGMDESEDRGV
ncbi:uncharacterized protein EV420DRAFT_1555665 [Desarmillaria tabescens]|uniref:Ubiquitin-like domain-containing protein n=1 Tax=Armillaria tabescens TaxID=1929756 RepID=A0AA39K6E9_ARMTA|nr:uncharacterized protein EV420DRAFT_1555665 [Desarmillaria tabescens]KAK0454196.1 hypothetical protein EV420DRAFT_1555665 [Desarmillaria tabescens]